MARSLGVETRARSGDLAGRREHVMTEPPSAPPLAAPASYSAMWDHRPDLAHSNMPCDPEIAERFRAEE